MEILRLSAVEFKRTMSTGRTHPLLLGCEDAHANKFEVVVKLRGPEITGIAQAAELVTAQLADDLGLAVPQAAVVEIPPGFEAVIADGAVAGLVKDSPGLNFGSLHLGPGFTTWPPGRTPIGTQRDQAADIFAFDALIQNPDRRISNPNLWAKSERIGVYDHEQAFSFLALPIIGGSPGPWAAARHPEAFRFLEQHVFYASLRGGRLDLGPFQQKLSSLTEERLRASLAAVPLEWLSKSDFHLRVFSYLMEARQQGEDMVHFLQHVLR